MRGLLGTFDRYVLRETALAWAAVAGVLVLVVVVNRFAVYLGQAASGTIPASASLGLLGLSVLGLLEVIVPVSLFLAAMLTLGRLYRDNEAVAAFACGLTPARLYRPFAVLGISAALLLAGLALWGSPWAHAAAHRLEVHARSEAEVSVIVPGRFKELSGGQGVFYAGGVNRDSGTLDNVFAETHEKGRPTILSAPHGTMRVNPETGERHLLLSDGYRYAGDAGALDWTVTRFRKADLLVQPGHPARGATDVDRLSTGSLLARGDRPARAALEWRIAQPFTVLVLLLIAVPLAHVRPRQGRYARLVPAILVYLVYFNLLGVARVWVAQGTLGLLPGVWVVPLIAALGGAALLSARFGRQRRREAARAG